MSFLITLLAGRVGTLTAKAIVYGVIVLVVVGVLMGIRQHYVNEGWRNHAAAVQKQDNRAVEANQKVEEKANKCSETNGFWDVVTQGCRLQEEK